MSDADETLVRQGRYQDGEQYLSSQQFSENLTRLSRHVATATARELKSLTVWRRTVLGKTVAPLPLLS